jgi:hypothetical protein
MMIRPYLKIAAIATVAAVALAQEVQPPKERGVRLRDQPTNVQYDVELIRGGGRAVVPVNYKFQNGDRFVLRVKVAAPYYVYLLNRTFVGAPDQIRSSRQIRLVPDGKAEPPKAGKPAPQASAYSLVYPASGDRQLAPGVVNMLPGPSMALEMDEHPGAEHMVLVLSPTPLKVASMFSANGELRVPGAARSADERAAVEATLNDQLAEMARNAELAEAAPMTRSIDFIKIPPPGTAADAKPKPFATPEKTPVQTPAETPKPGEANVPKTSGSKDPKPPVARASADSISVGAPKHSDRAFVVDMVLAHYGH